MSPEAPSRPARHSGKQKLTLLALGALAMGTVFLLPRFVSEPWLGAARGTDSEPPRPAPTVVSPSTAAENTHYRQEAQRVLADIVAVRDRLVERKVEVWAELEFGQGLRAIEDGDGQYTFGEYKAALETYRNALDRFNALEALGQQKLATALAEGTIAIEQLDVPAANASSALATVIAPQDGAVQDLAERAEQLPRVADRLEAGDTARARGELQAARGAYRDATELDPRHQRAAASLAEVESELIDQSFRRHMSRGFQALEQGDFDGARAAFAEAESIRPGSPVVTTARAQVANQESLTAVNRQLAKALELERGEQWGQAVAIYEALLGDDPSLTEVRVKLIPARVRADLDRRLAEAIAEPLALASAPAHRSAQAALADARGIPNPGPRLSEQIAALDSLLVAAVSVVEVELQSDNLTEVTLFRVAELGRFQRTVVKLRPGRYVAAGTRKGFRDVRVEFTVTGKPLADPVVVRCEEPI